MALKRINFVTSSGLISLLVNVIEVSKSSFLSGDQNNPIFLQAAGTASPDGTVGNIDLSNAGATIVTDAEPTDGSVNPVQSNGVYDALSLKLNKNGDTMTGTLVVPTVNVTGSFQLSGVQVMKILGTRTISIGPATVTQTAGTDTLLIGSLAASASSPTASNELNIHGVIFGRDLGSGSQKKRLGFNVNNPLSKNHFPASTAGTDGFSTMRIDAGVAPTTNLGDGDIWRTTGGIFLRQSGTSMQFVLVDPSTGLLPDTYLPQNQFSTVTNFPATGSSKVLYLAQDTNILYRWNSGTSTYISVSGGSGGGTIATVPGIQGDADVKAAAMAATYLKADGYRTLDYIVPTSGAKFDGGTEFYNYNPTTERLERYFATADDYIYKETYNADFVTGPASVTGNNLVVWDANTGKKIKEIGAIADTGNSRISWGQFYASSTGVAFDAANGSISAGGFRLGITTRQAAFTTSDVRSYVECDGSVSAFTVTLHTPSTPGKNKLVLKRTDSSANIITISGTFEDGSTSYTLIDQFDEIAFYASGSVWRVEYMYSKGERIINVPSTRTLTVADWGVSKVLNCFVTATAAVALTTPTAALMKGLVLNVIKIDASANAVTINSTGGTNINGSATLVLSAQYAKSGPLKSNGTQLYIF